MKRSCGNDRRRVTRSPPHISTRGALGVTTGPARQPTSLPPAGLATPVCPLRDTDRSHRRPARHVGHRCRCRVRQVATRDFDRDTLGARSCPSRDVDVLAGRRPQGRASTRGPHSNGFGPWSAVPAQAPRKGQSPKDAADATSPSTNGRNARRSARQVGRNG